MECVLERGVDTLLREMIVRGVVEHGSIVLGIVCLLRGARRVCVVGSLVVK